MLDSLRAHTPAAAKPILLAYLAEHDRAGKEVDLEELGQRFHAVESYTRTDGATAADTSGKTRQVMQVAPASTATVEARVEAMAEELAILRREREQLKQENEQLKAAQRLPVRGNQRQGARRCYRCQSTEHLVRDCPQFNKAVNQAGDRHALAALLVESIDDAEASEVVINRLQSVRASNPEPKASQ